MLTKLQALEFAKEWLDRFRSADGWAGHEKVAEQLEIEIILEKVRAKATRQNGSGNAPERRTARSAAG